MTLLDNDRMRSATNVPCGILVAKSSADGDLVRWGANFRFRALQKIMTFEVLTVWCGREDSNFHGLSPTTTSTLRVYQFRHDR